MPKPYDQDFKDSALRMRAEALPERGSVHAASQQVGGLLGVSPETLAGQMLQGRGATLGRNVMVRFGGGTGMSEKG
jgi:hypothetical protein